MKKELKETNKWKYDISIKQFFEKETTPELVEKLCNKLIVQLNSIKNKVAKSNLIEDDKYYVDENLTELIDHFEFLKEFANGKIPKEEWKDYDFDGNYESWFNDYLTQLYDLGDKRVVNKNNSEIEKLIWIY
jgi:hypothetical protein